MTEAEQIAQDKLNAETRELMNPTDNWLASLTGGFQRTRPTFSSGGNPYENMNPLKSDYGNVGAPQNYNLGKKDKSNTLLYVGLGLGLVSVVVVIIIVSKKN
tara:strand:- start:1107 stop:1412 length:306 start_codon:yes stop_codon:yes gene_type:complete